MGGQLELVTTSNSKLKLGSPKHCTCMAEQLQHASYKHDESRIEIAGCGMLLSDMYSRMLPLSDTYSNNNNDLMVITLFKP